MFQKKRIVFDIVQHGRDKTQPGPNCFIHLSKTSNNTTKLPNFHSWKILEKGI